jgi:hypothetical protein
MLAHTFLFFLLALVVSADAKFIRGAKLTSKDFEIDRKLDNGQG